MLGTVSPMIHIYMFVRVWDCSESGAEQLRNKKNLTWLQLARTECLRVQFSPVFWPPRGSTVDCNQSKLSPKVEGLLRTGPNKFSYSLKTGCDQSEANPDQSLYSYNNYNRGIPPPHCLLLVFLLVVLQSTPCSLFPLVVIPLSRPYCQLSLVPGHPHHSLSLLFVIPLICHPCHLSFPSFVVLAICCPHCSLSLPFVIPTVSCPHHWSSSPFRSWQESWRVKERTS